jgi:hypothetical protein
LDAAAEDGVDHVIVGHEEAVLSEAMGLLVPEDVAVRRVEAKEVALGRAQEDLPVVIGGGADADAMGRPEEGAEVEVPQGGAGVGVDAPETVASVPMNSLPSTSMGEAYCQ